MRIVDLIWWDVIVLKGIMIDMHRIIFNFLFTRLDFIGGIIALPKYVPEVVIDLLCQIKFILMNQRPIERIKEIS